MGDPMRLVFMGSDPLALPLLEWLAGEGASLARLVGVVTGVDQPSGRGQAVKPNSIKAWAVRREVAVLQPAKLDAGTHADISALRPDVALVVAYGRILKDDVIAIPRLGTLNLHASLLPKYRGASPIQTAVASGESGTGLSLMRIVRELDAGPVADVEQVAIAQLDTAADVETKLARAAIPLVSRAFPLLRDGKLEFREQDRALATYCRRHEKADGVLDFASPARVLSARINGLQPWPSVAVEIMGAPIKLGHADWLEAPSGVAAGTVMGSDPAGLRVATGLGTLRIRRLQRPGGRMLEAAEFLRGFPVPTGTVLPSSPMPSLVSDVPFRR
jgi:methionyl-tRNA formyltransferase